MLLAEGIPSLMRRPAGFDVPDFMAAGPRELLVARSALEAARDVLLQNDAGVASAPSAPPAPALRRPARLLALLLLAVVALTVVLFMATHAWD